MWEWEAMSAPGVSVTIEDVGIFIVGSCADSVVSCRTERNDWD